jgi:DNA-binding transcriptional LysR family regulator
VSLGITPYYSSFYLPMITSHLKKTHPGIKLDIVEDIAETLITMILHEHIDLGVFVEQSDDKDIAYNFLYREEIVLAVPSDYMLHGIDSITPLK